MKSGSHEQRICLVLLLAAIMAGCYSESSGTDRTCRWTGDALGSLDLRDNSMAWHLSEDAGTAEIIAIRFADGHNRPGTAIGATMADYNDTRDQCMATLFQAIADHHHVSAQQVRESMYSHRHTSLDVLVVLSFTLAYVLFAYGFSGKIWRRFPPAEGRLPGLLSVIVVSPAASLLGVVLGEGWARYVETVRMGYGHLNLRAERIPWAHHRVAIFAAGLVIFWMVSWFRYRISVGKT